jgi:hypothetical protein
MELDKSMSYSDALQQVQMVNPEIALEYSAEIRG